MKRNCILLVMMMNAMFCIAQEVITMRNDNGVYTIPCMVNGLKLRFIFDTGAADVSISAAEALFMLKNEYLSLNDIVDSENYILADGTILENTIINIPEIRIGSKILTNVRACVVNNTDAPLLLGQSAITLLGPWYIDGDKLILGKSSQEVSDSVIKEISVENCVEEAKKYESYGNYKIAIGLFKKACSVKDYSNYYEFANFCIKNRMISEDCKKNIPYDYIFQAALNGNQSMIDLLKKYPSIFNSDKDNALRYYTELINSCNLWFLCKSASSYCGYELGNKNRALEFVRLGVEHNDSKSLHFLAYLHNPYLVKIGSFEDIVEGNVELAKKYYTKSLEVNADSDVMCEFANLLLKERDKKGNYELAMSYLKRAGELGNEGAMEDLMLEYFDSKPRELDKSLYWAKKIIKNKDSYYYRWAMSIIGSIHYMQGREDESFSYLEIAHTDKKGVILPLQLSTLFLAECYQHGCGTTVDYHLAHKYYYSFVKNNGDGDNSNLAYALRKLGYQYLEGLGVEQSFSNAFTCYMEAAKYGDPIAASFVANAYREGSDEIHKDIEKSIYWYEKAAKQGHAYSWYSLGWIYSREGYGNYNTTKAVECFNKAIEYDKEATYSSNCYYELGMIYEYGGGGISKSYSKAGAYYKKAAELGHDKAKEKMKEFE